MHFFWWRWVQYFTPLVWGPGVGVHEWREWACGKVLNTNEGEISCCLGLMIKAGLAEDNLNALSGEASQKVSSVSKDDIAAESLRTNAYAKDPGTIRRVIDKIIMLLNQARAA